MVGRGRWLGKEFWSQVYDTLQNLGIDGELGCWDLLGLCIRPRDLFMNVSVARHNLSLSGCIMCPQYFHMHDDDLGRHNGRQKFTTLAPQLATESSLGDKFFH